MKRILITGALGQIGSELTLALRDRYGRDNVIATDIRDDVNREIVEDGSFRLLDCRDGKDLAKIVRDARIDTIYHLAALLSATAEHKPQEAWDINMNGLMTVLEIARTEGCSVFTPSS